MAVRELHALEFTAPVVKQTLLGAVELSDEFKMICAAFAFEMIAAVEIRAAIAKFFVKVSSSAAFLYRGTYTSDCK